MMLEAEGASPIASDDVNVRSFRRKRESQRGQRRFAVEPGAAHARAGQKVGDGFQAVKKYSIVPRRDFTSGASSSLCSPVPSVVIFFSLFSGRREQSQSIRHNGDLRGQAANQFSI